MESGTEEIFKGRIEELDSMMLCDEEYVHQSERYRHCLEKMKELIGNDPDSQGVLYGLDEVVGEYSSRYGEVMYQYAFHDGMKVGLEHREYGNGQPGLSVMTKEDMADMIRAYDILCLLMVGTVVAPGMAKGLAEALNTVHAVIERNMLPSLKQEGCAEGYAILDDDKRGPEERARLLMGIKEEG